MYVAYVVGELSGTLVQKLHTHTGKGSRARDVGTVAKSCI